MLENNHPDSKTLLELIMNENKTWMNYTMLPKQKRKRVDSILD